MWKSFLIIFVWMLYNKNFQSYGLPRKEKDDCSREEKNGNAHFSQAAQNVGFKRLPQENLQLALPKFNVSHEYLVSSKCNCFFEFS